MAQQSVDSPQARDLTRTLVRAVRDTRYEDLPPDVVFLAKHCLLDWMGVTLAGHNEPLTHMLRDELAEQGGNPQATLVGSGHRVNTQQAALVNGAASHALDFDDVAWMMSGHPTVPVAPALLALAEWRGSPARDVIAAFVAGFEMECRVGALVLPGHYRTGWHATGTLGTFGAAAACAHLLGLDEEQWLHAMGIAGAQAAGLKSMFGTMTKPFHAGKAAANGLLAATLAARGFTSNPAVLETPQGFGATQTGTFNPAAALDGLGESFAIRTVLFKYHAACYGTHELIEGVLRLRDAHGLQPADVERISLTVPAHNMTMCNIQEPATALEGKFSMRFTAAMALVDGDLGETAFTDDVVHRPDLVAVRDRVHVEPGEDAVGGTRVEIALANGAQLTEWVNLAIPETDLDRQWERLVAKFRSLATPVLGARGADDLLSVVSNLESQPSVGELLGRSVPAPVGART